MYYCDCKKLNNGNFRGMAQVTTYSNGICENCHYYAVLDVDAKRDHVDHDLDITKTITTVTPWHREVKSKKQIAIKKAKRLTLDEELKLVNLSIEGVPSRLLALTFGVARSTISSIFRRHNIHRGAGRPKGNCNRGLNLIGGV